MKLKLDGKELVIIPIQDVGALLKLSYTINPPGHAEMSFSLVHAEIDQIIDLLLEMRSEIRRKKAS